MGGAVVRVWGGGIGVYWGASARTTRYHDLHVMLFVMWFLLVNGEVLVSARPPLAHPHAWQSAPKIYKKVYTVLYAQWISPR